MAEKFIGPNVAATGGTDRTKEAALALFKQFVHGFHEYFQDRMRYFDDYREGCLNKDYQANDPEFNGQK